MRGTKDDHENLLENLAQLLHGAGAPLLAGQQPHLLRSYSARLQSPHAAQFTPRGAGMKTNPYYASRAQAAYAAAEAADDPRDQAAWRAAAKTWEQLAKPATETFSMNPYRLQLAALKRDAAEQIVAAGEPECGFNSEGYKEDLAIAKRAVAIEF